MPEPTDSMRACARSRGGLAHAGGDEGCQNHPAVLRVLVQLGMARHRCAAHRSLGGPRVVGFKL